MHKPHIKRVTALKYHHIFGLLALLTNSQQRTGKSLTDDKKQRHTIKLSG